MSVADRHNDVVLVHWLVSRGADPYKKGRIDLPDKGYYGNLLNIAAAQGKVELLKYFVETCKIPVEDKELDSKTGTNTGWTGLQWAAYNGQTEAARYLLDKSAKPDERADDTLDTPLMQAVSQGHFELAKMLVQRGARWHLKNGDGNTALHLAANYRHLDAVKWLVSLGADTKAVNKKGKTPLRMAGSHGPCFDCLSTLK